MRAGRLGGAVVCVAVLAACGGGAGASAPSDASIDDFCATKDWFVDEGIDRFRGGEFPPPDEELAALSRDWAKEFTRVGTPDNMSANARAGFERFVDRLDDIDGGTMATFNWDYGDWENTEEKAFAEFMANTCG